jgi:drug/metabolite transporter (DMT)-like permease
MTLGVLALVLLSAVLHATWNLWTKQLGSDYRGPTLMWLLTGLSAALYAPVGLGSLALGTWRPGWDVLPWIALSAVLHVAYFLLLLRGYRQADLSLVYPVARGTGPLLAAAGAITLLGERPGLLAISGALLISAGVLVLTLRFDARSGTPAPLSPGMRYGLLTGVFIALYTLWDSAAVRRAGIPPLFFYWSGEVVRVFLFAPLAWRDRAGAGKLWREHRARLVGIAALSPLSYILILIAFRTGAVTHIAPAREVSILIGTWLGARMLGEGDRRRRWIASSAFALGVVALAAT